MGRAKAVAFLPLLLLLSPFQLLQASSPPLSHQSQDTQVFEKSAVMRTLKQEHVQTPEVHCSRERSRAAWKIIEEYLMPFVEQENYEISRKCRLHADNDMFREQEQHKIHVDINEWRCRFCKKSFRAEKFLDQHFDNRHYHLLNDIHIWNKNGACKHFRMLDQSCYVDFRREFICCSCKGFSLLKSQGHCLADLCGALHCDSVMESKLPKSKCNPAAAARNRHLCESLADSCFPVNRGSSSSRLHEFFLHQFCDAHTCTGKRKPFAWGGKKQKNVFYIAISVLILMLLPVFYLIVYLYQREMKRGVQDMKRISKTSSKTKPS